MTSLSWTKFAAVLLHNLAVLRDFRLGIAIASRQDYSRRVYIAVIKHGRPGKDSEKDRLLELFAHFMAMGYLVCVNPGFHFSDAQKLV